MIRNSGHDDDHKIMMIPFSFYLFEKLYLLKFFSKNAPSHYMNTDLAPCAKNSHSLEQQNPLFPDVDAMMTTGAPQNYMESQMKDDFMSFSPKVNDEEIWHNDSDNVVINEMTMEDMKHFKVITNPVAIDDKMIHLKQNDITTMYYKDCYTNSVLNEEDDFEKKITLSQSKLNEDFLHYKNEIYEKMSLNNSDQLNSSNSEDSCDVSYDNCGLLNGVMTVAPSSSIISCCDIEDAYKEFLNRTFEIEEISKLTYFKDLIKKFNVDELSEKQPSSIQNSSHKNDFNLHKNRVLYELFDKGKINTIKRHYLDCKWQDTLKNYKLSRQIKVTQLIYYNLNSL